MISRVYSLIFILVVVGGMIFQRHYMRSSKKEVSEIEARLGKDTVLVSTKSLTINRYHHNLRSELLRADTAEVLTSGDLSLEGDIQLFRFEDGLPITRLRSETASGYMRLPSAQAKKSNRDSVASLQDHRAENLRFPEKVKVFLQDGQIETTDLVLNFDGEQLETQDSVIYRGSGKSLRGQGMSYKLRSGEFELGGPVTGVFDPVENRTAGKGR